MFDFAHMDGPAGEEHRLEHELKFRLPADRVAPALACLEALCRPDPIYPANEVHSLYYDTPGLELLFGKLNGDLFKTKVRLRWYRETAASHGSTGYGEGGSFIELKQRFGTQRKKLRAETPHRAAWIASTELDHADLREAPAFLGPTGRSITGWLRPYLVVRYHRRRFDDPLSATRISLDTDLAVERVNPRLLALRPAAPAAGTAGAVLEIKNRDGSVPPRLAPLLAVGARLAAFSKYGACFSSALTGSASTGSARS